MAALAPEDLDATSLQKRIEAQKLLVGRLVSEGKDASAANVALYELSKALSEMQRKTAASA